MAQQNFMSYHRSRAHPSLPPSLILSVATTKKWCMQTDRDPDRYLCYYNSLFIWLLLFVILGVRFVVVVVSFLFFYFFIFLILIIRFINKNKYYTCYIGCSHSSQYFFWNFFFINFFFYYSSFLVM